jgi:hypothetical protein
VRRLAAGLFCILALAAPATAEALRIASEPIESFQRLFSGTQFGPFTWRGGLTLSADDPNFGGLSGLLLSKGCEEMLAVSDSGAWLKGRLTYRDGTLSGFSNGTMAPIRDSKGGIQKDKAWLDSESLAWGPDGTVAVGFERRVRFGLFDMKAKGFDAPFKPMPHPKAIDAGPENGEVEALVHLSDGRFLAIAEKSFDPQGNIRAWGWQGRDAVSFALSRYDAYKVTDLAVLADGSVLTLERRFTTDSLPGMAIRRFQASGIKNNAVITPDLLLEATAPLYVIDNMEGIAVCEREGETRVTLLSDDNFNAGVQSTILLQFAYRP